MPSEKEGTRLEDPPKAILGGLAFNDTTLTRVWAVTHMSAQLTAFRVKTVSSRSAFVLKVSRRLLLEILKFEYLVGDSIQHLAAPLTVQLKMTVSPVEIMERSALKFEITGKGISTRSRAAELVRHPAALDSLR